MMQVTAAIFFSEGNVLIMRRAPGLSQANFWEFPGGKVESNETPEQCLARELKEELLINATIGEFLADSTYVYTTGEIHLEAYAVTQYSGKIQLTVHDEMEWVTLTALQNKQLLPADVIIAKKLLEVLK